MKLTILGSGTSIIKKDRLAPGYLLELNSGESFLFDCGATAAQQFANINFDYSKIIFKKIRGEREKLLF